MENAQIGLKIAINYVYGHAYNFTENIFKFVQIIQEKYWAAFFYPNTGFLLPQINLKETCGFFLPRDGQIYGVKKSHHFFIKIITPDFFPIY